MTSERWQRMNELFHAALQRDPDERAAFLRAECAGDMALCDEVQRLVRAHESAGDFAGSAARERIAHAVVRADDRASVSIGDTLGPYQILARISEGRMGQVYRGRDTRVSRDVAIKVLPPEYVADAERRQRFEREARAIATLVHPHICTLFEFDRERPQADDAASGRSDLVVDFLVMELVEGESLADRLARGPLPVAQAIARAVEIADALSHAHRKGIVHRDLKPANVMLTSSGAKLLDFGLAKAQLRTDADAPGHAATLAGDRSLTVPGMLVGTLPYMAPEQVEGRDADARTDVWTFGCVVYQMLSGTKPFEGASPAGLIGAILKDEPRALDRIAATAPFARQLQHIVGKCLAKDPEDRWQDMRDVRDQLQFLQKTDWPPAFAPATKGTRHHLAWGLSMAALVIVATTAFLLRPRPVPGDPLVFTVATPDVFGGPRAANPAISPDGRYIAYMTGSGRDGPVTIWLQPLDSLDRRQLLTFPAAADRTGTGPHQPFWSPDGQSIGFFAERKLKRANIATGETQSICDVETPHGGTWLPDGAILFAARDGAAIFRVPAAGGTPVQVTRSDLTPGARGHVFPAAIDENRFLFATLTDRGVWLGFLDGTAPRRLLASDSRALYTPAGYLLFVKDTTLFAQPFDSGREILAGSPIPIAEDVRTDMLTLASTFSVSANGTLVYRPGAVTSVRELSWVDRHGIVMRKIDDASAAYRSFALTRDERGVIAHIHDAGQNGGGLWLVDLERGTRSKITFEPHHEVEAVLSPDGSWIAFSSDRGGTDSLYRRPSNGSGTSELLWRIDGRIFPADWSKNWIVANVFPPGGTALDFRPGPTDGDIWAVSLAPGGKPMPYLQEGHAERRPRLSRDERWMAYVSYETGSPQVYVRSFPDPSRTKLLVSNRPGVLPAWRADGRELYYVASGQRLMAVSVEDGPDGLRLGEARELFRAVGLSEYAPAADGSRFLIATAPVQTEDNAQFVVMLNWPARLTRK
jgi:serine/threonine protein kinase/Tol biopolymer transport system component